MCLYFDTQNAVNLETIPKRVPYIIKLSKLILSADMFGHL